MTAHLADIESIKRLKARYFRCMDLGDWAGFGEVFARDAVVGGGDRAVTGRAAIVELIRTTCAGTRTAHQGFLPEIDVLGPGRASGIWAMTDYFEVRGTDPLVGFTGYGHYEDGYVLEDGGWRIARSRLTRLKLVPFPGGLPDFYRR